MGSFTSDCTKSAVAEVNVVDPSVPAPSKKVFHPHTGVTPGPQLSVTGRPTSDGAKSAVDETRVDAPFTVCPSVKGPRPLLSVSIPPGAWAPSMLTSLSVTVLALASTDPALRSSIPSPGAPPAGQGVVVPQLFE